MTPTACECQVFGPDLAVKRRVTMRRVGAPTATVLLTLSLPSPVEGEGSCSPASGVRAAVRLRRMPAL